MDYLIGRISIKYHCDLCLIELSETKLDYYIDPNGITRLKGHRSTL
ncbi:MAG: hypothetical protein SGI87_10815 [Flavobacteriales bacterium]|nr:hypothetical protein [Flavobacteriales bacterium]